jgi:hypothetical protein
MAALAWSASASSSTRTPRSVCTETARFRSGTRVVTLMATSMVMGSSLRSTDVDVPAGLRSEIERSEAGWSATTSNARRSRRSTPADR